MVNIIIGVGGTGAKVVEAVLHTSAVGLGPDNLTVGFVDQDQSNGNVTRTLALLNTLTETRRLWRGPGRSHHLSDACELLKCDIQSLSPGHEVWVPHREQSTTLAHIFGAASMEPSDKHLFDLLFAAGADEQEMPLDEGYRGRPNIGSAAMTARVGEDVEFWRALIQRVEQAQGGEPVNLVLAGSVFGGTGAAGFPTLARLIRRRLAEKGVRHNIRLGGILMLPYFGFERPKSEEGVEGNVARREQLLLQSQGALKYYYNLFEHEEVFNDLYMVGWNRMFELGYHSAGAADQANPPLAPELLAALGVLDFFAKPATGNVENRVYVSSRAQDGSLGWSDLPSPIQANPSAPFDVLGRMLRFSVAWLHWKPLLAERGGLAKFLSNDPWYKLQKLNLVDFKKAPPEAEMRKLTEYVQSFLWWAACIQNFCRSNTQFNLWQTSPLIETVDSKTNPYDIVDTISDANRYAAAYDNVVTNTAAADPLPSAADLNSRLNNEVVAADSTGLGVFVGSLFEFSKTAGVNA